MSPTVFREDGYRFFFFSREETRMHVHVHCAEGEAKFWLEPQIELARNHNLSRKQLQAIETIIEERQNELRNAWTEPFPNHFYWPDLDVDLSKEIIKNPERFPLKVKA